MAYDNDDRTAFILSPITVTPQRWRSGIGTALTGFAAAPLALSLPEGWLGQTLLDAEETPFAGPCRRVEALNRPAYL